MRKSLLLSVCLLAALVAFTPLQAQQARSSVNGQVMDNTGGVIPGVNVVATNTQSSVEFPTVTNDTGAYRIDYLQPGSYKITVSLPGFKTVNQTVALSTGDSLTIDFTMEEWEKLQNRSRCRPIHPCCSPTMRLSAT